MNIGSLTRNARIRKRGMFMDKDVFWIRIIFVRGNEAIMARSSGMDAKIVYINRNNLALFRSGWFPDFIINKNVGMIDNSNIT